MTAPSPRLSPTAGLFNALVPQLSEHADARTRTQQLVTARDYADSTAAGDIDRAFLAVTDA